MSSPSTPRPRAMRFAEAGFAAIALVLFAKVLASLLLTNRAQRRTDELFVSASHRIEDVATMNSIIAEVHAEVERALPRALPAEMSLLSTHAREAEERFRAVGARYLASREGRAAGVQLQDYFRMTAVTRVYFATLQRVVALSLRGEDDAARVLLHDALEPTRVRQSLIAAGLLREHAARTRTLYAALGASRLQDTRVDFGANLLVLALLLVVRRLVMHRLEREDDQRARHLAVLAERNRDLDEFAHRVAHDLKGLVNPITGYASLISEAPQDTPRVTRYAARISRKTDEVVAMVDELLRLARAGNVSRGPSALGAVAAAVLEQFEAEVIGTDARVTMQIAEVAVNVGEVPLREVLQNLLQNSLKYRAPDRPLELVMSATVDEEMVRLQVRDNGVGMSGVVARHAHEPFFRASFDRDVPGSGLGLAIVHRIATAHGGSLHVESTEGIGTAVVVMLPTWSPGLSA